MSDEPLTARHILIHGHVQGVFYRDWTVKTARALGLAGWVRNLPDGTVEAHCEGDAAALDRMVEAMHEGPPRARPTRVEAREVQPGNLDGFARR